MVHRLRMALDTGYQVALLVFGLMVTYALMLAIVGGLAFAIGLAIFEGHESWVFIIGTPVVLVWVWYLDPVQAQYRNLREYYKHLQRDRRSKRSQPRH
jgi:hypothetical protein